MTELKTPQPQTELSMLGRDVWQSRIAEQRRIGEVALSNFMKPLEIMDLDDLTWAYGAVETVLTSGDTKELWEMNRHVGNIMQKALASDELRHTGNGLEVDIRPAILADPKIIEFVSDRDMSEGHQRLIERWPKVQEALVPGVRNGIELGYIPADVENRLDDAINKTSVRVVDPAILESQGIDAYYLDDCDEMGVHPEHEDMGDEMHELVHKISGGTFMFSPDDMGGVMRIRGGFSSRIRGKYRKKGLDEAVTQHITRAILDGDFETFDPDERTDGDKIYYAYRKTIATLIKRSGGLISTSTLTKAYFEESGPGGSTDARRMLIREVNNAYGEGALVQLDQLLEWCDLIDEDDFEWIILGSIHPPVIDEKGNVAKIGCIR